MARVGRDLPIVYLGQSRSAKGRSGGTGKRRFSLQASVTKQVRLELKCPEWRSMIFLHSCPQPHCTHHCDSQSHMTPVLGSYKIR